jgi:nitrogen fixation/metabolism regulation signal transduction histidine kinase
MMKVMTGLFWALAAIGMAGCSSSKDPRTEAAERAAQVYVDEQARRVAAEILPMAGDVRASLAGVTPDDPAFLQSFGVQVAYRNLSEAAIVIAGPGDKRQPVATANLDQRGLGLRTPAAAIEQANKGGVFLSTAAGDRIEAVTALEKATHAYLYVSRRISPDVLKQLADAGGTLPSPSDGAPVK